MFSIESSRPSSTSILHHGSLNQTTRSARIFLDNLRDDKPEEYADCASSRRRATLKSGDGDKLTLLDTEHLTVQDIRTRMRIGVITHFYHKALERKLKKIQRVGNKNSQGDIQRINNLLDELKNLPFYDDKPLTYASNIDGFGKSEMIKSKLFLAASKTRLWLREHRVAGVPIAGALFVAKMTIGLWLLSQFDKVFHSHATLGNPIPQGFSLPGLTIGGMKNTLTTSQAPQATYPVYYSSMNYPAYQPSAPIMPTIYNQGYYQGSGL